MPQVWELVVFWTNASVRTQANIRPISQNWIIKRLERSSGTLLCLWYAVLCSCSQLEFKNRLLKRSTSVGGKSVYFERWMSGIVKELFPGSRLKSCRNDGSVNVELKQKAVSVAHWQQKLTTSKKLVAPQGFEPRYLEPKSSVLPLDEGAILCRRAKYKFLADYRQLSF